MALLEVSCLSKKFRSRGQKVSAVNNVSFHIDEGECLGIVGESGCGKSTTANIIARLIKEDSGKIIFDGVNITSNNRLVPVGKSLQMIFQNPQDSFDPRDTVLSGIMQGVKSYGMYSNSELREKALSMFGYVGLKESYADSKTYELSGGECQRAAIARAIICAPKLLICDEATSALDVLVQAQIIDMLKRLKDDGKMSMLFITHDLPLASVLCDRILVMHKGEIVEEGKTREVLDFPKHYQTQKLIKSVLPVTPSNLKEINNYD